MKREGRLKRLFYLDWIRALATLSIVLTHYNALYIYLNIPRLENTILTVYPFGIYLGNLGVSLFFIISGAALMYTYDENFDGKIFFKKRILSIYPMWWIAYILAASYWFLTYRTVNPNGAEPWKLILTLIGFDQYFAYLTPTFGIIGEWFLGCIILMYFAFPVLRYLIKTIPKITVVISLALYSGFVFFNPWPIWPSANIFVRLPEFLFGMIFCKYWRVDKRAAAISGLILLFSALVHWNINDNIRTTYMGIALFVALAYLADYVEKVPIIKFVCRKICQYSYAIYICHHIIIYEISKKFDLATISHSDSFLLFLVCCEMIILISCLLYYLNRKVIVTLRMAKGLEKREDS